MTRSEIIELMARQMYDDEYRAMDELVSAMDRAAGKKCHVHSLGKWESVNKLYEERTKSALNWVQVAGLAIVPIEPSEAVKSAITKSAWWSGPGQDPANVYRAMIAAAIKEQEGRD